MKVRLALDVDEATRFVVAKYFGVVERPRRRATRRQIRAFAQAAFRAAVKEQAGELRGRARATAARLVSPPDETVAELRRPDERQPSLSWT